MLTPTTEDGFVVLFVYRHADPVTKDRYIIVPWEYLSAQDAPQPLFPIIRRRTLDSVHTFCRANGLMEVPRNRKDPLMLLEMWTHPDTLRTIELHETRPVPSA